MRGYNTRTLERTKPLQEWGALALPPGSDRARCVMPSSNSLCSLRTLEAEVVKDLKQENVSKGGVYVSRGQKSQGLRDPPQGDFNPKENIVDFKGRRLDLLGAEGRMLGFKVPNVNSGVPRSTDLHKKRETWYSLPNFSLSGSARSCVGGAIGAASGAEPERGATGEGRGEEGAPFLQEECGAAGAGRCLPVP